MGSAGAVSAITVGIKTIVKTTTQWEGLDTKTQARPSPRFPYRKHHAYRSHHAYRNHHYFAWHHAHARPHALLPSHHHAHDVHAHPELTRLHRPRALSTTG